MADIANLGIGIDARQAKKGGAEVNSVLKQIQTNAGKVDTSLKKSEKQLDRFGKAGGIAKRQLLGLVGGLSAVIALRKTFNVFVDFEQGLVGVGKTANIAGEELDSLGDDFIKLSTEIPVATSQLLSIGQAAGQLGITGAKNILVFTETIAKLGVASDLAGDEAATTLARLLNVTGENVQSVGILASVIVSLGNNFAASEREIARMATQVASATAVFNVSSAEASALGAAMASLGVRAELGGSAVGRTFRAIDAAVRGGGKRLEQLAVLTGRTSEEIAKIFSEDATAGFTLFIEGLGRVIESGGDSTKVLKDFGLAGEEILKVLPTLAKNSDLVSRALSLSSKEVANATALNEEAARAFDTLGSAGTRFKNVILAVVLNFRDASGPLTDFVDGTAAVVKELFGITSEGDEASDTIVDISNAIKALTAATATFIALKLGLVVLPLIKLGLFGTATGIKSVTIALIKNPFTLLAVAISAGVAALVILRDKTVQFGESTVKVRDIVGVTFDVLKENLLFVIDLLKFGVGDAIDIIKGSFNDFEQAALNVLKEIGIKVDSLGEFILGVVKPVFNFIATIVKSIGDVVGILVGRLINAFQALANLDITSPIESAKVALTALGEAIDIGDTIDEVFTNIGRNIETDHLDNLLNAGKKLSASLKQGFIDGFSGVDLDKALQLIDPLAEIRKRIDKLASDRSIATALAAALKAQFAAVRSEVEAGGFNLFSTDTLEALGSDARRFEAIQKDFVGRAPRFTIDFEAVDEARKSFGEIIADLRRERSNIGLNTKEIEKRDRTLKAMVLTQQAFGSGTEAASDAMAVFNDNLDRLEKAEELFDGVRESAIRAFDEIANSSKDVGQSIANTIGGAFEDLEDTIVNFAKTGKLEFSSLIDNILEDILRLTIRQQITAPLAGFVSGFLGNLIPSLFSASGNVFVGGQVTAFQKGGIVNSPTPFAFGGGVGVAGEAGAEGILPLRRTRSGDLGVLSSGGSAPITITVNNFDSPNTEVDVEQSTNADGGREILVSVKQAIVQDIKGNGEVSQAIGTGFGLRRTGAKR